MEIENKSKPVIRTIERFEREGELDGRTFTQKYCSSITFTVIGVAMVLFGSLLAGGVFGGGVMYLIGGGLFIGSIFPFALASRVLCDTTPLKESKNIIINDEVPTVF